MRGNLLGKFAPFLLVASFACGEVQRRDQPDAHSSDPPADAQVTLTADASPQCVAETDVEFCDRLSAECGDLSAPDNCGESRVATCGSCTQAGDTCGGRGIANVCGCLPPVGIDTTAANPALAGIGSNTKRAQSITVSQPTPLATIRLVGGYSIDGSIGLTLYHASAADEAPDGGDRMATASWPFTETGFGADGPEPRLPHDFDVTGWEVTLLPGETYWLVVTSTVSYLYTDLYADNTAPLGEGYSGGRAQFFNGESWIDNAGHDLSIVVNPCP